MRSLSPEEAELWARVAATIRPLSRDPIDRDAPTPAAPSASPSPPSTRLTRPVRSQIDPKRIKNFQTATLDGGWDHRLRTGRIDPDRVLDLHGHGLDRAWLAIDRTLERAIASGERVVLLITGHERKGDPPLERGRIRAAVHDWLAASRHAPRIAAVRGAHRRHGGGGSLYIILRKNQA
ncbi:MAG TPA: Smr/MutS family protein [Sphingomicrobium sp.]|nr:Smr/MutS family protein [Sphingomicrobium sp.]